MARARRTRFAASFVAVIAAGCSRESPPTTPGTGTGTASGTSAPPPSDQKPSASWSVYRESGTCWAEPQVDCDPAVVHHTCNPPAPMRIVCPQPMPADNFRIVSFDGKTCTIEETKASIACPSYDTPPPPDAAPQAAFTPRAWSIGNDGDHCTALRTDPGAPPDKVSLACGDYFQGGSVVEDSPDRCRAMPAPIHCPKGALCNPPRPRDVKCP